MEDWGGLGLVGAGGFGFGLASLGVGLGLGSVGLGSLGHPVWIEHESLILAQNERWRHA